MKRWVLVLTAVAISLYYFWLQWGSEDRELRQRGASHVAILSEFAEFAVYTSDRAAIEQLLQGLAVHRDVAYAMVLDAKLATIAERRFGESIGRQAIPSPAAGMPPPRVGQMLEVEQTIGGRRHLELFAAIGGAAEQVDDEVGAGAGGEGDVERGFAVEHGVRAGQEGAGPFGLPVDGQGEAEHLGQPGQPVALLAGQPLGGRFAATLQRRLGDQAEFEARIVGRDAVGEPVQRGNRQPLLDRIGQGEA